MSTLSLIILLAIVAVLGLVYVMFRSDFTHIAYGKVGMSHKGVYLIGWHYLPNIVDRATIEIIDNDFSIIVKGDDFTCDVNFKFMQEINVLRNHNLPEGYLYIHIQDEYKKILGAEVIEDDDTLTIKTSKNINGFVDDFEKISMKYVGYVWFGSTFHA